MREQMRRGIFLCIDGIDGCGKSTHARLLKKWLNSMGLEVLITDEPTDNPIGRIIKKSLSGKFYLPVETEALLFAADRMQHIFKVVRPAIESGKIVITERYVYSSLAYQHARGLPMGWLEEINRWAIEPDLTIIIDLPVEIAMRRKKRRGNLDKFERDLGLQRKVRENYLQIARDKGLKVIDGRRSVEEVQEEIREIVKHLLGTKF